MSLHQRLYCRQIEECDDLEALTCDWRPHTNYLSVLMAASNA
jgi:hypothetical protein